MKIPARREARTGICLLITRPKPGALNIYPNELSDSGRAGLAGAHAGHRIKRGNPDLAVADGAGAGGLDDHTDQSLGIGVVGQHLDANLRNEIHGVFGATVDLGVATLAAVTVSLRHGQTVDTCGSEGFLDIVKLMRLNDSGNELYLTSPP